MTLIASATQWLWGRQGINTAAGGGGCGETGKIKGAAAPQTSTVIQVGPNYDLAFSVVTTEDP